MSARADAYQAVTDRIIAALEAGTVPWHRPWRTLGGPRSYSGRPYRGVNVWLLELEADAKGYNDPRWVTFNACQAAGGKVRKGEKSTAVYFWKRIRVVDADAGELEGAGEPEGRTVFLFRSYRVFNVSQCDGLEPYVAEELTPFEPIRRASELVTRYLGDGGPALEHGGDRAYYRPATDTVRVPQAEAFEDGGAYYGTLFHELVHSTGHKSRLDRPEIQAPAFGTEPYAREELVAELGAAMLCGVAGVDRGELAESASYIAGWLRKLRDDRRLIVSAAAAAQKAADRVAGVTFEDRDEDANGHKGAAPAPVVVRPFVDAGHRPMVARYRGRCGFCGLELAPGSPIHYSRKAPVADRVACVTCVSSHRMDDKYADGHSIVETPAIGAPVTDSPAPIVGGEGDPSSESKPMELEPVAAAGDRTYRIPGTTFEATVSDPEDVAGAIALEGWKRKAPAILEDRRRMAVRLEELVSGRRPRLPSVAPAVKGTALGVAGPFADRQRRAYVEATGREPRSIVEALEARGVTDAGELERARAQWAYRGKGSGDALELCEPVRELAYA